MQDDISVFLTIGVVACGLGLVTVLVYSLATARRRLRLSGNEQHRRARRLNFLLLGLGIGTGLFLAGSGIADLVTGAERSFVAWTQVAVGLFLAANYPFLDYAKKHHPALFRRAATISPSRLDELGVHLVRLRDIEALLRDGQRVRAVKVYRDDTGASLPEAVAGVDRIARQIEERHGDDWH